MNNHLEVISAFLDDEPFESEQLADALSGPEGRAALIELIALRHLMQPAESVVAGAGQRRPSLRVLLAVAAVFVAMAGGFWVGERRAHVAQTAPPAATRVVETGEWQPLP
jgi:hypothetical protein